MKTLLVSTTAAMALLGTGALAQDSGMRQLGAHVHGEARLSVAVDPASGLALAELIGAAWNFYGFEHAPRTEAERETVAQVRQSLSDDLIAWPDRAGCTLTEISVSAVMTGEGEDGDHHDSGHDHEAHHDHDHEHHDHEHHDHDDHDHENEAHGHDGHDHGQDGQAHSDVTVSWTYQCAAPDRAVRFDAAEVFAVLPRLETIDAEAFDGERAAVRTLTPQDAVITLE